MYWDFSDLFNSLKGKTIKDIKTEENNSLCRISFEDGDEVKFASGTHEKNGDISSSIFVERKE